MFKLKRQQPKLNNILKVIIYILINNLLSDTVVDINLRFVIYLENETVL